MNKNSSLRIHWKPTIRASQRTYCQWRKIAHLKHQVHPFTICCRGDFAATFKSTELAITCLVSPLNAGLPLFLIGDNSHMQRCLHHFKK